MSNEERIIQWIKIIFIGAGTLYVIFRVEEMIHLIKLLLQNRVI